MNKTKRLNWLLWQLDESKDQQADVFKSSIYTLKSRNTVSTKKYGFASSSNNSCLKGSSILDSNASENELTVAQNIVPVTIHQRSRSSRKSTKTLLCKRIERREAVSGPPSTLWAISIRVMLTLSWTLIAPTSFFASDKVISALVDAKNVVLTSSTTSLLRKRRRRSTRRNRNCQKSRNSIFAKKTWGHDWPEKGRKASSTKLLENHKIRHNLGSLSHLTNIKFKPSLQKSRVALFCSEVWL